MSGADAVYFGASALAAASTLLAVTRRNPIYSAAWMLVSLFSVGVIYLLLHATFLFVIQILLYAGAILVLFLFVIMLLNPRPEDLALDAPPFSQKAAAFVMAALLFVSLSKGLAANEAIQKLPAYGTAAVEALVPESFGTLKGSGEVLYDKYLVAFEMISVLITASIAAVILLAKRRLEPGVPMLPEENTIGGHRRKALEELAKSVADDVGGNGNGHGSGHGALAHAGHGAHKTHAH